MTVREYLIHDEKGEIMLLVSCDESVIELHLKAGEGYIEGRANQKRQMVVDGQVVNRPAPSMPETHTIPASTDWTISDMPAGTEVEIDGEVMGVTDETGLTLNFAAPGVWPVILRPPFPWVEASCEVTVT